MAATARRIEFTAEDLSGGDGAFVNIEVPGEYELTLTKVEDYDKRAEGKSHGWLFFYSLDTGAGIAEFREYISFGENARWKLIQVLVAHDYPVELGLAELDPNSLVGDKIGALVDYPRDSAGAATSKYRELIRTFALPPASPAPVGAIETSYTQEDGSKF